MKINQSLVKKISQSKQEPKWMLRKRLDALAVFNKMPMPKFGPDLSELDFEEINYYQKGKPVVKSWAEVPVEMRETFEKLGIPQSEQELLAGVGAQADSEMIYQNLKQDWVQKGIIFEDMDAAVEKYPELVKKYFMSECVVAANNKFAALHGAVWSGGSFVYVPKGVRLVEPVEGYFFLKSRQMGQFEHTLIVAEEGAQLKYIEGCSAPRYSENSLHSGAVEIFVGKRAKVAYLTIQNWSKNVLNFNTKRALVDEEGVMEWVSGSFGSKMTMLYPTSVLKGKKARSTHLSVSLAGEGQELDTGGKAIHLAAETSADIVAKSIAKGRGKLAFRGLVRVEKGAKQSRASLNCENLLVGTKAEAVTYPAVEVKEQETEVYHEAKTGKIAEEQLFYLMSRGLTEKEAMSLIVNGFLEPVIKKFPLEYAVELNRLIDLELS